MKKYFFWVLALLFALPATAQKKQKTTLEDIIGKTWYPAQRKGNHGVFGFHIQSQQELSYYNGCNSTYYDYEYTPHRGFKLSNGVSTLLACPLQDESFSVDFLRQAHSFELKGDTLTFYSAPNMAIMTVYGHLVIEENPAQAPEPWTLALTGNWVLQSTNNPLFAELQSQKGNIYVDIPPTGHSLMFLGKEAGTPFSFIANFYVWQNMSVRMTDYPVYDVKKMKKRAPKAYTLYEDFVKATGYEMDAGKLRIRTQLHTYTFEKQP
jgi:hypothetical protein